MKAQSERILFSRAFTYFIQLVDTMNYTQAAKILGITQPALTQQIKKLEKSVDAPLFQTSGKNLQLTDAGKILYETVQEVYGLLKDAQFIIQKDSTEISGRITIGVAASVEDKVLTDFIIEFYQEFPDVEINLIMVNQSEMMKNIENGKVDMGIFYLPQVPIPTWKSYETRTILQDEILFLHHDQKLKNKKEISFQETLDAPWVTYPRTYFVHQVISNAFKNQKIDLPKSVAHLTKPDQMFRFSNETGTYTALPKSFFQAHEAEGELEAIPFDPPIKLELAFVYREEKNSIPRIKKFFERFNAYLASEDYISRLKNKK